LPAALPRASLPDSAIESHFSKPPERPEERQSPTPVRPQTPAAAVVFAWPTSASRRRSSIRACHSCGELGSKRSTWIPMDALCGASSPTRAFASRTAPCAALASQHVPPRRFHATIEAGLASLRSTFPPAFFMRGGVVLRAQTRVRQGQSEGPRRDVGVSTYQQTALWSLLAMTPSPLSRNRVWATGGSGES